MRGPRASPTSPRSEALSGASELEFCPWHNSAPPRRRVDPGAIRQEVERAVRLASGSTTPATSAGSGASPRSSPTSPRSLLAATPGGRRRALLVGINYRSLGSGYALSGCINDVKGMRDLLVGTFGFRASEITLMTDDAKVTPSLSLRPTGGNIRAQLSALLQGLGAGDLAVFHYSGHGLQVRDNNGDEKDGRDEAIFTLDRVVVRDDDIRGLIAAAASRGVRLRMFMDSCHSGTVADLPWMLQADNTISQRGGGAALDGDVVLVSGSGDLQTSADTSFGGVPQGAMTAMLRRTLQVASAPAVLAGGTVKAYTWADVVLGVRRLLADGRYSQVPVLSAASRAGLTANMDLRG